MSIWTNTNRSSSSHWISLCKKKKEKENGLAVQDLEWETRELGLILSSALDFSDML